MLKIDRDKILSEIKVRKPKNVMLISPDGLQNDVQKIAHEIEEKLKVKALISGEACYGSCDLKEDSASQLKIDLIFHIGHTIKIDHAGKFTVFVDAFDDIKFDTVIKKTNNLLKKKNKIGICTTSQHLPQIVNVKQILERLGFNVLVGEGGKLVSGQVFGCEFQSVYNIKDEVDVFLFLGQSRFHSIGVALSTGKPTYMLDPYLEELIYINKLADSFWKKAVLSIYKARDVDNFGIIIGLREGQRKIHQALKIKRELEKFGKNASLLVLRDITPDRVNSISGFDAFIQTACPRISIDGLQFKRPMLSIPQVKAMFKIFEGKEINNFLIKNNWF